MALYDVACATPLAMVSRNEESSSSSLIDLSSGPVQQHGVASFQEGPIYDEEPTDVTETSILAGLGMLERYDGRRSVGEAETRGVASGTLFARPVYPADTPVRSDVRSEYGVPGQNSVVVPTSCAALDDGVMRIAPKSNPALRGPGMGPLPAVLDDGAAAAPKGMFDSLFNSGEYRNATSSQPGGALGWSTQNRVSNNPFATVMYRSPPSPMPPPLPNNRPLLFFGHGDDDDNITISRRVYDELIDHKHNTERLLGIVAHLEAECIQREHRLNECNRAWQESCERISRDHEDLKTRFIQYERNCTESQNRVEQELLLNQKRYVDHLSNVENMHAAQIVELNSKIFNLESAKQQTQIHARDVNDWYHDAHNEPLHTHERTRTFDISDGHESPQPVPSFHSCDIQSKVASVFSKYSNQFTSHSSSSVVRPDISFGVTGNVRGPFDGAFGVTAKPIDAVSHGAGNNTIEHGSHVCRDAADGAFGVTAKPVGGVNHVPSIFHHILNVAFSRLMGGMMVVKPVLQPGLLIKRNIISQTRGEIF
jgi:hypothetical protein